MDSFVDRKTGYLAELVVGMRTQRADTVRTEREPFWLSSVRFPKSLFAVHDAYSLA